MVMQLCVPQRLLSRGPGRLPGAVNRAPLLTRSGGGRRGREGGFVTGVRRVGASAGVRSRGAGVVVNKAMVVGELVRGSAVYFFLLFWKKCIFVTPM